MRVLLSGYTCDPLGGSEGANTWFTACELARAGATVHLLTRAADRDRVLPSLQDEQASGSRIAVTFLDDSAMLDRGQPGVYLRYGTFQRKVTAWARAHPEWDVAHHLSWGSLNHPVGLAGAGFPLVVGPVGGGQRLLPELKPYVDGTAGWNPVRNAVLAANRHNPYARRTARHTDLLLTTNTETADMAAGLGFRTVRPMLAEALRELPGDLQQRDPATVVWIGRFLSIKAAGLAVTAFREVLRHVPDAHLDFIGDGPTRMEVQTTAADLVESGAVTFRGRLEWSQAQQALARAQVHLFTSVRDSSSAQALEAAAWGVPTVALNLAGMRTFWTPPAATLVPVSPAATLPQRLGEAVVTSLSSDADAALAARDFAEQHTFAIRAQELLALYADLPRGRSTHQNLGPRKG